jgi:Dna[CI] antecedent, DciA
LNRSASTAHSATLTNRAFYRLVMSVSGWAWRLQDNRQTVSEAQRRHYAIPLLQAAQESPTLSSLVNRMHASSSRLDAVRTLLPATLRPAVQAGPIEDGQWCLLVSSNAVAAKLRQLLPALQLHLQARGLPVSGIRIKVQARTL